MTILNIKEYDPNLIFVELRDPDIGPGCEKFHGDPMMIRKILLNRMERRKIAVEDIVSNNPVLLERILSAHPILELSDEIADRLFLRSLSESDMAEIEERARQWEEMERREGIEGAYERTIALLAEEIRKDDEFMDRSILKES